MFFYSRFIEDRLSFRLSGREFSKSYLKKGGHKLRRLLLVILKSFNITFLFFIKNSSWEVWPTQGGNKNCDASQSNWLSMICIIFPPLSFFQQLFIQKREEANHASQYSNARRIYAVFMIYAVMCSKSYE